MYTMLERRYKIRAWERNCAGKSIAQISMHTQKNVGLLDVLLLF